MSEHRYLLLLRHGKSSWSDPDLEDHQRPLNRRGHEAAAKVGKWIAAAGHTPDVALVSSSLRTRQTWGRLVTALPVRAKPAYEDLLYRGDPHEMLMRLREVKDEFRTVLMIGHNPGTSILARGLAGDQAVAMGGRFLKFPTAGLAVFRVKAAHWRDLPAGVEMECFVDARSLA